MYFLYLQVVNLISISFGIAFLHYLVCKSRAVQLGFGSYLFLYLHLDICVSRIKRKLIIMTNVKVHLSVT